MKSKLKVSVIGMSFDKKLEKYIVEPEYPEYICLGVKIDSLNTGDIIIDGQGFLNEVLSSTTSGITAIKFLSVSDELSINLLITDVLTSVNPKQCIKVLASNIPNIAPVLPLITPDFVREYMGVNNSDQQITTALLEYQDDITEWEDGMPKNIVVDEFNYVNVSKSKTKYSSADVLNIVRDSINDSISEGIVIKNFDTDDNTVNFFLNKVFNNYLQ